MNIKKIGALVLAGVMVLGMSVSVMAEPATLTEGKVGSTSEALEKSVNIPKSLKVYNPDAITINGPTISYSYSVVAVEGGQTITDSGVTLVTKDCPATLPVLTGTSTNTIAWVNTDQLSASNSGVDSTKNLTVDFTSVPFDAAGVYRYAITETIPASSYVAAGVLDGTSGATEESRTQTVYLDVYVRDPATNGGGFQIFGYVLASSNGTQPASPSNKLSAFTTDEYPTSNLALKKTLNNDVANNTHKFPFHVAFTNNNVTANVQMKKVANGTTSNLTAGQIGTTTSFEEIAHNETVEYLGIPAGTTVSVYETNNVAGTNYKASASVASGNGTSAAEKTISSTSNVTAYVAYSEQNYNSKQASVTTTTQRTDFEINFVNTLEMVSPTGVALRFAPYVIMAIAATFLMIIARRKKDNDTGYAI